MNLRPILKLAAPAALALLLAGCITDPYHYRGGYGGDYYYGQPSVEYRHHGYGGYGYPSYYGRSGWSFSLGYGYPYGRHGYGRYGHGRYGYGYGGYGGFYGGWPHWYGGYGGWPGYPPIIVRPGPGGDADDDHGDDDGRPTWRDLEDIRDGGPNPPINGEPQRPRMTSQPPRERSAPPPPRPRPSVERPARPSGDGSRVERARQSLRERDER